MKCNSLFKAFLIVLLSVVAAGLQAQKVGLVMDSYVMDRWYLDQKLFSDKIKELGGEVKIEVAYGDPAEQTRLGKKLLAEGVDVLVIVAIDGHKAAEIVDAAKAVNIPVIAYDRLILSKDVAIYISYDNEKIGELQAQYAMKKVPKGNYLLMNGPVIDNNAVLYREGQLKVLKPSIDNGKIKIVGDFIMDWGEISALMKVDEFLTTSKDKPNVIIAANDALASGSIQALPPEMKGKVVVTGQDADLTALKYIVGGAQTMTIYKPIKALAYLAAESAMQLAKKEHVKGRIKMQSGDFSVDAILLEPVVVDKTNFKDTVVKDGHVSMSELVDKK